MLLTAGVAGEAGAIAGDTNPNLLYDDGAGAQLDWRRILQADGEGRVSLGPAAGPASSQRVALPPRTADVVFMVCAHAKGFVLRLDDLVWRSAAD